MNQSPLFTDERCAPSAAQRLICGRVRENGQTDDMA